MRAWRGAVIFLPGYDFTAQIFAQTFSKKSAICCVINGDNPRDPNQEEYENSAKIKERFRPANLFLPYP